MFMTITQGAGAFSKSQLSKLTTLSSDRRRRLATLSAAPPRAALPEAAMALGWAERTWKWWLHWIEPTEMVNKSC